MLFIEDDVIYLTKGDDAALELNLTTGSGAYEMNTGDVLTFTVRERPDAGSDILLEISSETSRIAIAHADTANLSVGAYSADIQILTADGKRVTVFPKLVGANRMRISNWKNFVIMPEVSMG